MANVRFIFIAKNFEISFAIFWCIVVSTILNNLKVIASNSWSSLIPDYWIYLIDSLWAYLKNMLLFNQWKVIIQAFDFSIVMGGFPP